jgi:serine/threonine-protein kinase HipA
VSRPRREKRLAVLLDGARVGDVIQEGTGRLCFEYDAAWIAAGPGIPLSLSMSLGARTHPHRAINAYMWGLLPDNEQILARWAQRHQVSANNAFALLGAVGADCPGAVQFVGPDRVDALTLEGDVEWLDEAEIGRRLAGLRADAGAAGRVRLDRGQFSLGGAQLKTAFLFDGTRWGVPSGRIPTTHILKPAIPELRGQIENEHFCLGLFAAIGLPTAHAEVRSFAGERVIVVRRYDRLRLADGTFRRVHQEDMCQAFAIMPSRKYENDGGPGIIDIMTRVLATSSRSDEDRRAFMHAIALNYLIGGTDAHGKNFSVLLGADGAVRFAPLYDIASILPYASDPVALKMPLRIGTKYYLDEILPQHWEQTAAKSGYPASEILEAIGHFIRILPDAAAEVADRCRDSGLDHPVLGELVDLIATRCRKLAPIYGRE